MEIFNNIEHWIYRDLRYDDILHITVFESPEKLIKKCRYDLKILKDFNLYNLLLIFLKERGVNTEENKTIIIKIDEYIGWLIKNEYVEEFNNDQNKNS